MKFIKLVIFLSIPFAILSCQNNNNTSTISLHPSDLQFFSGPLEKILEIEKVVPLETNEDALIASIYGFAQSESGILLRNKGNKSFFIYEEDGSFRAKIAKDGKGPGEYIESYGQDWIPSENSTKDEIVISDIYGKKLLFFSADGEFISEAKIQNRLHSIASISPQYIVGHQGRFPLKDMNRQIPSELIVLDREGTMIKQFFPYTVPLLFEFPTGFSHAINTSGTTYFKQMDPTVYQINQDLKLDTLWKFDFGNLNPDTSYLFVPGAGGGERVENALETNPFLYIGRMIQNNKTLMVSHYYKNIQHIIFINNSTHNMQTIKADSLNQIGALVGFPVKIPEWSFKESFIYDVSAFEWRETLGTIDEETRDYMRKTVPGFTESESLTENDNPLLVYFRIRDF